MIRGRIAIPDVDPKTWRSRGRKKKRTQPAMASAIVTPAPMKKRRLSVAKQQMPTGGHEEQPRQSAIMMVRRCMADLKPGIFDAPLRGCGA